MEQATASTGSARVVRYVSAFIGVILIGYALSDDPFLGGGPGFGATQAIIAALGLVLCVAPFVLPSEWSEKLLLTYVSLLVCFAVLEVVGEGLLGFRYRPGFEYHERYLFGLRPDHETEFVHQPVNGGHRVISRINEDGFRGPELLPAGTNPRVVVYGDSFIHAMYSPLEETFCARLGVALEEELGRPIEVVNAGVSSYGPDQVLLRMEDELSRLEPDLVLVAIFAGNDYGDLLRNKIFELDEAGRAVPHDYEVSEEIRAGFELSRRESILKRAFGQVVGAILGSEGSETPFETKEGETYQEALVRAWLENAENEYQDYVVNENPVVTNVFVDFANMDISLTPEAASARYKVELMSQVVGRIATVATDAGAPLLFVFIPHPVDVVDGYDDLPISRARYPDYRPDALTAPLVDAARRSGVPFVDLSSALRARAAEEELFFKGGDDHWNADGQAVAAREVAEQVVERRLLDAPPAR